MVAMRRASLWAHDRSRVYGVDWVMVARNVGKEPRLDAIEGVGEVSIVNIAIDHRVPFLAVIGAVVFVD